MDPSSQGTYLLPPQASTFASDVDGLFNFMLNMSIFFFVLIIGLMIWFVILYRRRPDGPKVKQVSHNTALEVSWSVIPLLLVIVIFVWGFQGFLNASIAPRNALEIQVTARKWAWTFQYADGKTDSGELHVPANTPVRLIMTSDDVIHSFFVPDFRVKQDVVPGRFTTLWFEATQLGEHHVFCAEYCGDDHSKMYAKVIVMEPAKFNEWQSTDATKDMPLAQLGELMYKKNACMSCHSLDGSKQIGPSFKGLFGKTETLADNGTVQVDEQYLRESITDPNAKVVAGFQPVMPPFKGILDDRQLSGLIEFIKLKQ